MKYRIGIVDAHPIFRHGVKHLINNTEDLILDLEAESRTSTLSLLDTIELHVLLLSTNLPQTESIELARELFEKKLMTKIIVLSAYEEDWSLMFEMFAWRVAGYLSKKESSAIVIDCVRKCIRGELGWVSHQIEKAFQILPSNLGKLKYDLSPREQKILILLAYGASNRYISSELFLAEKTVKNKITELYEKIGVKKRSEVIAWAWQNGFFNKKK